MGCPATSPHPARGAASVSGGRGSRRPARVTGPLSRRCSGSLTVSAQRGGRSWGVRACLVRRTPSASQRASCGLARRTPPCKGYSHRRTRSHASRTRGSTLWGPRRPHCGPCRAREGSSARETAVRTRSRVSPALTPKRRGLGTSWSVCAPLGSTRSRTSCPCFVSAVRWTPTALGARSRPLHVRRPRTRWPRRPPTFRSAYVSPGCTLARASSRVCR
eukprot:3374354-Rhodomonas_salina.1